MRRLIAALAVLLLAGCGEQAPSAVVPADATIYVGMHASEAERLLAATSRDDVDFERDVRPWLGERAAYFARAPDDYGLVFDAEDDEAAEAFARKVTAAGPLRASAVIDGRLVIASSRDLLRAANAAADAGSLADSTKLDVAGEDGDDPLTRGARTPRAFAAALEQFEVLPDELPLPIEALAGDGPLSARVRDGVVELRGLARGRRRGPGPGRRPRRGRARIRERPTSGPTSHWPPTVPSTGASRTGGASTSSAPCCRTWAAGLLFVQGDGSRLLAETSDEDALRREAVAVAKRLGPKRADLSVGDRLPRAQRPRRLPRDRERPRAGSTSGRPPAAWPRTSTTRPATARPRDGWAARPRC